MLSFFFPGIVSPPHLLNYIPKWQNCLLKNLFKCCPPNTYMPLKLVFLDDSWEMKEKLFGRKNFSLIDFQERFFFWLFAIDEGARRKADGKTFFLPLYGGFLSHISIIIWFINFVSAATNTTCFNFFASDHNSIG